MTVLSDATASESLTADIEPFRLDMSRQRTVELITAYEQHLESLPTDRSTPSLLARAEILASLVSLTAENEPEVAEQYLGVLEDLARACSSPCAEVFALLAQFSTDLSPEALPHRRQLSLDIMDLLDSPECDAIRHDVLPTAYFMYLGVLLESGEIDEVDRALSLEVHAGGQWEEVVRSRFAVMFRCARASMDGHTELAEQLADQGHEEAIDDEDLDADAVWIGQMAVIRWMQGRVSEMEQILLQARQADPTEIIWDAAAAWIWTRQGRLAAARGLFDRIPDLGAVRRGRNWLAAVAILTEVACQVGDDDTVERFRRLLEPFADRLVPMGLGVTTWGTAARPLALIALRQSRTDDAITCYRAAIALCSRMGAQAWLCQAQAELARLLLERGENSEARSLLDEASSAARYLRLREVEQLIDQMRQRLNDAEPGLADEGQDSRADQDAASRDGLGTPSITVFGGFSVTAADGTVATWKSKKARTLLKILLARRGDALARDSAIEMLWPDTGSPAEDIHRMRNRLAVAVTTVRRTLDPARTYPSGYFVESTSEIIRLRSEHLAIDVEQFLDRARQARSTPEGSTDRGALLRQAFGIYRGEPLPDAIYEPWAEPLHREAKVAFFDCAHALAEEMTAAGDHYEVALCYQRIIDLDPYDQAAHVGLIAALESLGARHRADEARAQWRVRMAELGLDN